MKTNSFQWFSMQIPLETWPSQDKRFQELVLILNPLLEETFFLGNWKGSPIYLRKKTNPPLHHHVVLKLWYSLYLSSHAGPVQRDQSGAGGEEKGSRSRCSDQGVCLFWVAVPYIRYVKHYAEHWWVPHVCTCDINVKKWKSSVYLYKAYNIESQNSLGFFMSSFAGTSSWWCIRFWWPWRWWHRCDGWFTCVATWSISWQPAPFSDPRACSTFCGTFCCTKTFSCGSWPKSVWQCRIGVAILDPFS